MPKIHKCLGRVSKCAEGHENIPGKLLTITASSILHIDNYTGQLMESSVAPLMKLYFSDFFEVSASELKRFGAFDISLVSDLPLFIDPFLLFNSRKPRYRELHSDIIKYLRFLKRKSEDPSLDPHLIQSLYRFPEVDQNWLGFTTEGNRGHGLDRKFAGALHSNLNRIFSTFGDEEISRGSHLEKLCLIDRGVGKDNISDFTTNLIKGFLLEYTQEFARKFIRKGLKRKFSVARVRFDYRTETWRTKSFVLPCFDNDYVLLTPRDMLAKEDTWINRSDLVRDFDSLCESVPNEELRAKINNYFLKVLPEDATAMDRRKAANDTIRKFPRIIDYFIRRKEKQGRRAESISSGRVKLSETLYHEQFGKLVDLLSKSSDFYRTSGRTYEEALSRVQFLKDVIENKGGHKIFYVKGRLLERESDAHILYRFTWYATPSDVSREVNDGRGPADFKISRGSGDKSIVEFKLASNPQLEKNLQHQTRIYKNASDAKASIKVILFFSEPEEDRVKDILKRLGLDKKENVVLIDARDDNKPSGSKAA
jgi:hypothetical protein